MMGTCSPVIASLALWTGLHRVSGKLLQEKRDGGGKGFAGGERLGGSRKGRQPRCPISWRENVSPGVAK